MSRKNQPVPVYSDAQLTSQAQTIAGMQNDIEIRELQDRINIQKNILRRLLHKLLSIFNRNKAYYETFNAIKDEINAATGVNIAVDENLTANKEALEKTCDNLEKISLVLTKTSEQIENHGIDIAQMIGDRKGEGAWRESVLKAFENAKKEVLHDMETVVKGNPNIALYKSIDNYILAEKGKNGEVKKAFELRDETNGGYGFYELPASDIRANELTELCKVTNAHGEILEKGIYNATKAIMIEKDPSLTRAANVVRGDVEAEKIYQKHFDSTHNRFTVTDYKHKQSITIDFSKSNEITADFYRINKDGSRISDSVIKNAIVLRNAENGIEHTLLKNSGSSKFAEKVIRLSEVQSIFKQFGIENVAELLIPQNENTLTKAKIQNTLENYTKNEPKPLYIDAETFPDTNLRRTLQEQLGTDMIPDPREITKLDLKGKGIRDITGLDRIEGLTSLDISNNRIEGDVSLNLPALATLVATNNMITSLDLVAPMARTLDLSHNSLTVFNSNLPTVVNLNLSNNNLTDVEFKNIPRVEVLDFTNNEMTQIDDIGVYLQNLQQLRGGSNLIEGDVVVNAPNLTYLRLEDNNINSLVVNSDVQVRMIEADHNPMSEAYIPEITDKFLVNLPQSCEVKSISEVPKEKLAPREVYATVTSTSSNGEVEIVTQDELGSPVVGVPATAAANANTVLGDVDFTRGSGVSQSAAREGSDSEETKAVVTEQKHTEKSHESSREEYKRDEKEDNQRFKEEKQASKGGEER